MPLIVTERHRPEDLEHWRVCERVDDITQSRLGTRLTTKCRRALAEMRAFFDADSRGYLGVSWGKDSVACAWLAWRLEHELGVAIPVVWVRLRDVWQNPESHLVRDAFLERWPLARYEEIEIGMGETKRGIGEERLVRGFAEAAERYGDRYVSGVRATESRTRRISMSAHGVTTVRVCRPIGWWSTEEVFALHSREDLPLHPAYGYTMGGLFDRLRIRVTNIGGDRGRGRGREGWERAYYPDVWAEAARLGAKP